MLRRSFFSLRMIRRLARLGL